MSESWQVNRQTGLGRRLDAVPSARRLRKVDIKAVTDQERRRRPKSLMVDKWLWIFHLGVVFLDRDRRLLETIGRLIANQLTRRLKWFPSLAPVTSRPVRLNNALSDSFSLSLSCLWNGRQSSFLIRLSFSLDDPFEISSAVACQLRKYVSLRLN